MTIKRDLVLIWLFFAAALPSAVQAQFVFVTNNGAITIIGYTGSGGAVVIPDTTNGLPVTSIGNEAFYQCTNLNSVTIPNSVTNIGHGAFAFCGNLTNVAMPDSVIALGICAFWNCTNLASATISTNVTTIEASDFDSCASLANITIPTGTLNIGRSAFQNCGTLTSVAIGSAVTNIGNYAFDACASLTAITVDPLNMNYSSVGGVLFNTNQTTLIQYPGGAAGSYVTPSTVTNIGNWAFDFCVGLTYIMISSNVLNIGDWALNSCTSLAGVTFEVDPPFNYYVKNIGSYAFESCSSLTNVTFPNSVTNLGYHTLDGCTSLTDVTIGTGIFRYESDWWDYILAHDFSDCPSLTSIYLAGTPYSGSSPYFSWDPTNQIATPTAYYLPDVLDPWDYISGLPFALWLPRVQAGDASLRVQTNQFGFNINWAMGKTIVVEACTNLTKSAWTPIGTNILTSCPTYFSDAKWTNYPSRFYRVRWP